jgi:uncharacterized PurR-regulated membrane protein YhhQ (DUF165 family)
MLEKLSLKHLSVVAYLLTIPLANWMINNVGTEAFPGGPHTIPVGFGFDAPSGVLAIGAALLARDYVQEVFGRRTVVFAILVGVALSYLMDPAVATASAVAFALGEGTDFVSYSWLRERSLGLAVVVSGVVGGVVDSFLFLWIAFGSVDFWEGQVVGKAMMAVLGGLLVVGRRAVSKRLSPL